MFIVYRWFRDEDDYFTEIVGVFSDSYDAEIFVVSYALLHMISIDDLTIIFKENVFLEKLIDEVMSK